MKNSNSNSEEHNDWCNFKKKMFKYIHKNVLDKYYSEIEI